MAAIFTNTFCTWLYLTQNQDVRLAIKLVRVMIETALTTFTWLFTNLTPIKSVLGWYKQQKKNTAV